MYKRSAPESPSVLESPETARARPVESGYAPDPPGVLTPRLPVAEDGRDEVE
jgi:hypothetical protein